MAQTFGRHKAGEVMAAAGTFLKHAHDAACWPSLWSRCAGG